VTEESHSSEHPAPGDGGQDQEYRAPEAEEIETTAEPSETVAGPGSSQVLGVEESNRWH
jgi:hypothetical protein